MRVGRIVKVIYDRKFGFIRSEHFREDVFFHFSTIDGIPPRMLEEGLDVEFEINEILRLDEQKLEATVVRIPARPLSRTLNEKYLLGMQAKHHPKARQRKPTWREKTIVPTETDPSVPTSDPPTIEPTPGSEGHE